MKLRDRIIIRLIYCYLSDPRNCIQEIKKLNNHPVCIYSHTVKSSEDVTNFPTSNEDLEEAKILSNDFNNSGGQRTSGQNVKRKYQSTAETSPLCFVNVMGSS